MYLFILFAYNFWICGPWFCELRRPWQLVCIHIEIFWTLLYGWIECVWISLSCHIREFNLDYRFWNVCNVNSTIISFLFLVVRGLSRLMTLWDGSDVLVSTILLNPRVSIGIWTSAVFILMCSYGTFFFVLGYARFGIIDCRYCLMLFDYCCGYFCVWCRVLQCCQWKNCWCLQCWSSHWVQGS